MTFRDYVTATSDRQATITTLPSLTAAFVTSIIRPRHSRSTAAYIVKLSRERSVARSVRLSVCPVHCGTRGSAIAEEPRDALRQLKYYGRFLTELLTRSSANPEEQCEHTVS